MANVFQAIDGKGALLDARFSVEKTDIILHSRGGAKGRRGAVNADYAKALLFLITILSDDAIPISGAWVDSTTVQSLPRRARSILNRAEGKKSPAVICSLLSSRMRGIRKDPGSNAKGGNSTKRIRIATGFHGSSEDLAVRLGGVAVDSNAGSSIGLRQRVISDRDVPVQDKKSCDVWTGRKWEILPVSFVYPRRESVLVRCPECRGPVVLMREGKDGHAAHFEHHPRHTGCSLVHKGYSGTPSTSPLAVRAPRQSIGSNAFDHITDEEAEEITGPVPDKTEKKRLLLARVGQGLFRERLLRRWGNCSVLGCGPKAALVASHIVAWRSCDNNEERLDVDNGLLLSPNLDKLFDRGLISFAEDGQLLVSPSLDEADAVALGLRPDMRLRKVPSKILGYLSRHREGTDWRELQT